MAVENLPPEVEDALLKVALGLVIALVAAILYNFNERITYIERNAITPENLKENLRAVITETERKHR